VEQAKMVPLMSSGWAAEILADKKSANAIARLMKFLQRWERAKLGNDPSVYNLLSEHDR
jgi:hypothetical protein